MNSPLTKSTTSTGITSVPSADLSDAKKKIVRFGRGEGKSMEDETGWSELPIMDSGNETGKTSSMIAQEWLKVLSILDMVHPLPTPSCVAVG